MKISFVAGLTLLSITCFVVSLTQVGYMIDGAPYSGRGIELFLKGWLGPLKGIFAWYANPLLFAAWVAIQQRQKTLAISFSLLSLLLICSFFLHTRTTTLFDAEVFITGYALGFWLWLWSGIIALIAGFCITGRRLENL